MLAHSEVGRFLLHRKLVTEESIVDGDVKIVEASRRNRNFKVINEHGPSYLIKQGLGPNGRATIAHESTVYQYFERTPENVSLRTHLPRYFGYDAQEGILILQLLKGAQDIREYHTGRGYFSSKIAAALGSALCKLHRPINGVAFNGPNTDFTGRTPQGLSFHRPTLDLFRELSNANLQLIRIIQNTASFPDVLDELREGWRVDSLVHYDLKWDNCLVLPLSISRREPQLMIVDWEFAHWGDSCWDTGSVFSNYLSFWLFSIPVSGEEPPDRFLELARYPLKRMQPAICAYWEAYIRGMGFDPTTSEERLLRSVKYAAARLLQTGFEQMQHSTYLTGNLICLLQLSLNILQRPHEAITHLLGISLQRRPLKTQ